MKTTLHKSHTRGHANHGWLDTYYTFSFANYYNPERIQFGNLRVLNDDIIAPGSGFSKHPHDNMEIITIPIKGSLMHEDSMGHKQEITENEVQVMSAGSGIFHSEFNASGTEFVNLLQIWVLSDKRNIEPIYSQMKFDRAAALNQWQTLVSPVNGPLKLNQQTTISRIKLNADSEIKYVLSENSFGAYLFLVEGEVQLDNTTLTTKDGIGIEDCKEFKIKAKKDSFLINIEI